MATTAIFGAGVMGETLLSGLIRSGRDVADLTITEKRADHAAQLLADVGGVVGKRNQAHGTPGRRQAIAQLLGLRLLAALIEPLERD